MTEGLCNKPERILWQNERNAKENLKPSQRAEKKQAECLQNSNEWMVSSWPTLRQGSPWRPPPLPFTMHPTSFLVDAFFPICFIHDLRGLGVPPPYLESSLNREAESLHLKTGIKKCIIKNLWTYTHISITFSHVQLWNFTFQLTLICSL